MASGKKIIHKFRPPWCSRYYTHFLRNDWCRLKLTFSIHLFSKLNLLINLLEIRNKKSRA